MKIKLAAQVEQNSIVNGKGLRTVIYGQGCPHRCIDCHNKQTWDYKEGISFDTKEIVDEVLKIDKGIKSIIQLTLSGGEPFYQSKEFLEIITSLKKREELNLWVYTGYKFEDLLKNKEHKELLKEVDVLVDGKFIEKLKSYDLLFKGSRNQRTINVKESLKKNTIIEIN